MRANVKPLTHWIIYKKYTVRFRERQPDSVTGILFTPEGELPFRYEPHEMRVELPDRQVQINEYGWEIDKNGQLND